jgi:hypothetical protein
VCQYEKRLKICTALSFCAFIQMGLRTQIQPTAILKRMGSKTSHDPSLSRKAIKSQYMCVLQNLFDT